MKSKISLTQRKIFFRKFTRKKFAVFFSLHKVIHISSLLTFYTLIVSPFKSVAQSDSVSTEKIIDLEEVEITGIKGPSVSEELSQFITVTTLTELEHSPSQSITDLLRYAGNVDLRQRGKNGIQSDVSIRGGSFDHSLILLNGINISDPQTGHLSLNLPVETDAIKRIEILSGPGSRIHGSNAFSGAVNFITMPSDTNSFLIASSIGEFGFFSSAVTLNFSAGTVKNLFHSNGAFSSGYRRNTDFRKQSIYYKGELRSNRNSYNFQIGYTDRAFGANGFYTPRYPDQFEENQVYLLAFDFTSGKNLIVDSRAYWRRHIDRFELFREGENWYEVQDSFTVSFDPEFTQFDTITWYRHHNHHINDVFGVQLTFNRKTRVGLSSLGWHLRSENIISTNIGYDKGIVVPVANYKGVNYTLSDSRSNFDMHFEQTADLHPFYFTGAILLNWNSYLPDKLSIFPGIDCRIYLLKNTYLFGNYNYSQGLPTFTDLTYEDPSNQGNNELKPYSQHSVSSGLRYMNSMANITVNYFYQMGHDVIDWVWFDDNFRFSPINIEKYNSQGFEFSGIFRLDDVPVLRIIVDDIRVNYTFIDMHKEIPGNVSKFFNTRHKFSTMALKDIFRHFSVACNLSYVEREGHYVLYDFDNSEYVKQSFNPYWLTDLRISYYLKGFTMYIEATNIFDITYIDVGSINQPGRWIAGGIKYKISGF